MNEPLGIVDLLTSQGFDNALRTKLVRHQDRRYNVRQLINEGWFDLYQAAQAKPVFKDCERIVALL